MTQLCGKDATKLSPNSALRRSVILATTSANKSSPDKLIPVLAVQVGSYDPKAIEEFYVIIKESFTHEKYYYSSVASEVLEKSSLVFEKWVEKV